MQKKLIPLRRRSIGLLALAATCALGSAVARGADVVSTWIDQGLGGAGNWNVATNWSNTPNVAQFPNNGNGGFTYDAIVGAATNTITLGQDIDVQNFTLTNSTITGPNKLTVHGVMTFAGGALRNANVTVPAGSSLIINPPSRSTLTGTLDNFGVGTWTGSGLTGDTFSALGVFNNHAGATFYANNSFSSRGAMGIGSFINAGTMIKSAGTESRWGNITQVNNSGTLDVRTGIIRFVGPVVQTSGGGTLTGGAWIINPDVGATGVTIQLDQAFGLNTIGAAARVDVTGATSVFAALDGIGTNQGYFRINGGYHFNAITGYTNSGTTVVGGGSALKVTGALANTGTIDINAGAGMLVNYATGDPSPYNAISAQIVQGRHGGAWDQAGITSTSARNATPKNTTLGILEGSSYLAINGAGATFFGTPVDADMVLVKYTYYGDTDLNGLVNFDDYSRIDSGFNNGRSGWLNGDFDGNGVVNFDDYSLIDLAFNTQGAPLRTRAVPEPGVLALAATALLAFSRRRSRR
jgi:hypothetical protein